MPGSSKYLQQSSEALEQTELRYDVLPAEPVQLSDASLDELCRRQTQEAARRRPSPGDSRAIQDSLRIYRDYAIAQKTGNGRNKREAI